jgi:hypothetical protein
MQYLRARYYDVASGTFNRLDPFFGNLQDPQSLHKYLYVHGDPIGGIDPTGEANLGQTMSTIAMAAGVFSWFAAMTYFVRDYAIPGIKSEFRYAGYRDVTGYGGRDATHRLQQARDAFIDAWDDAPRATRELVVKDMTTPPNWTDSWDMHQFFRRKDTFTSGNPPGKVRDSVTIDGHVYYVDEVNYFLWGMVNYLAWRDGIDNMSHEDMVVNVYGYRTIYWAEEYGKHTTWPRIAWAKSGWQSAKAGKGAPLRAIPDHFSLRNATPSNVEYTGVLSGRVGHKYNFRANKIEFYVR